ncbi:MAG: amidohydrolase [Acidimicrobiia bacterium]|nr:amidohydrolase [Acidimicrobiia bacterium]
MVTPPAGGSSQDPSTSKPVTCDLLVTGGTVVTVDDRRRVIDRGAVAITGDRIAAVGAARDLGHYRADRVIDATGSAVLPGLVDTHQHLFQYLTRGLGEGLELWPWLSDFMWPVTTAISIEEARIGAQLGAVEAARSGVTTLLDNHYAPTDFASTLAVADAIAAVGLRGAVARGMTGELTPMAAKHGLAGELFRYSNQEEIDITRACIEARPPGARVGVWPAPLNIIYVDQELVVEAVGLAHEKGVGWHSHCSEAANDPVFYLEEYDRRPVVWLAEQGLLGRGATLAHGIFLDDREVELVGGSRTGIAYCPISHQYIALGVMRLRDLRGAGATVALGLDGGSGHRLDMFSCMKQAVLLQRVHTRNPTESNGEEAIELATRAGAEYMGIEAGVIAPGKLADLVIVDQSAPHHSPLHRTVASVVYSTGPSDVTHTIVGGDVIFESGRCTMVDEAAIVEEANGRAADLVARAGLSPLLEPWRTTATPSDGA